MGKRKGIFVLDPVFLPQIYGPEELAEIGDLVDLYTQPQSAQSLATDPRALEPAEVMFTGWGSPLLDETFLELAPNLKAVFYGAGAAGAVATPPAFDRGIVVSSAYAANAIPVAEYTLASIVISLKHGWRLSREMTQRRELIPRDGAPGCYRRTVGLVSMGMIARTLLGMLKTFELTVLAYDPFLTEKQARELGVELVSLDELFERCHVVSLHAPLLDETRGMIRGRHLERMRMGATLINTARGGIVAEAEMIEVLRRRPDLFAILDVTEKEPPDPDSPLFQLPNVVLTPHIAGSNGQECRRMGRCMVEELKRYLAGEPLEWQVTPELAENSTHRSPLAASASPTSERLRRISKTLAAS